MSIRALLSRMDDVVEIRERVSLEGEVTRILLEHQERPVLLTDLNGRKAVGNLWADRDRIARSLNLDRKGIQDALLTALSRPVGTREIDHPGFMQNVSRSFNLGDLPLPRFYPRDGGRYVTSGVAVAELDGKRNLSFHRLMLLDERRFAIRLVPRHLYTMYERAMERGDELSVVFCVGVCPSILLAAACSVDYAQDEMEIASALRTAGFGQPMEVAKTIGGLVAPAHSEIVLEGRITAEKADEGPFVDITGTYDRVRKQPVVEIDRIYYRDDPLFHIILPGGLEHCLLMGMPREPMIMRTVGQVVPRVHGARLTEGGRCWLHGVVSVTKNKEGDGKNAIMAAFTGHPSMKCVAVVDEDIDIYDDRQVEWAIATRFQADRDLVVIREAAGSSLDPSAEITTSKVGLDATKPVGSLDFDRALPG